MPRRELRRRRRHADGRWLQMMLRFLLLSIAAAAVSSLILSQPSAAAFSLKHFTPLSITDTTLHYFLYATILPVIIFISQISAISPAFHALIFATLLNVLFFHY
jgi:hypothetical protein